MKIQKGTYNGKSVHYLTRDARWFPGGTLIPKYGLLKRMFLLLYIIHLLIFQLNYLDSYVILYALWYRPDYVMCVSSKSEWDRMVITEHEYLHIKVFEKCINRPDMIRYFTKNLDRLENEFWNFKIARTGSTEDMVANIKIDIDGIVI